jgi:drug/metabolite transporter (DMT)-like permease
LLPTLFAVLSAAMFGAALVTTQFGLRYMDALSGARISIPAATVLFWMALPWIDFAGWQPGAAGIFAMVGLFFPAAVTLLTFQANHHLGPNVAGTLGGIAPLFAVLGAALLLGEALGIRVLAATLVIMTGSIMLVWRGGTANLARPHFALWLPLAAALLRALAQVFSRAGLLLWPNPLAAAVVGYTVSAVIIWLAPQWLFRGRDFALNRGGARWFFLTGLLNGGAVLAMYFALASGPVQVVSPIVASYPLFTLMLSAIFLHNERPDARQLAGVLLTVAGVVLLLMR